MLSPNTTPPEKRKAVRAGNAAPGPPRVNGQLFEELRHRCRNPRCRTKLAAPVTNSRDAFCCRGCFDSFYLRHCLVCEAPIEQPRRGRPRLICRKAKCRAAFRDNLCVARYGRYGSSSAAINSSEVPDFVGPKPPLKPDLWRHVAGPQPSASQLHCATRGGEEAVETVNRTNLSHWQRANAETPRGDER
jgi:hypothetical protein